MTGSLRLSTTVEINRLLLHVDNSVAASDRLEATVDFATRFAAEVVGCYVEVAFPYGYADGAVFSPDVVQRIDSDLKAELEKAKTLFEDRVGASGSWSQVTGDCGIRIGVAARAADLAVTGQHDPDDARSPSIRQIGDMALTSGRPILVIPYIGAPVGFGRKVLVAWNGTRESARAVADAMPVLREATAVDVLTVDDVDRQHASSASLLEYLAAHGIKATLHTATSGRGIDSAELILSQIADLGADLLVMGAYGHSRAREFILGGATREILQAMTVPVMLSH